MWGIEFGQSLYYLLKTLGISNNRLAKAINVDGSLVNRWVNGKRIPSYNSMYIEDIAVFLAQNVKNSLQIKCIDKIFGEVSGTCEASVSIEDKIRIILYESQGYSLELQKKKKAENKPRHHKKDRTPRSRHLSYQDTIIFGTSNILEVINDALNYAVDSLITSKRKIYITYFNEIPIGKNDYELILRFQNYLLRFLEKGWEVHFLAKITDNNHRTIELVEFIKPFLSTGKFFTYYLDNYEQAFVGKDYVVISEYCAFAGFILNSKNAGSFFKTPAAVELYEEYVENLISDYGKPLLTYYSLEQAMDFDLRVANCEDTIGKRILYKDCFGIITIPIHLFERLLKRKNLSPPETEKALIAYKKRIEAFQHNICTYEHIDLYQVNFINHLIKTQQIYLYDHTGINPVQLEVEEIIQLLDNIIFLLKEYPNYHIAFLNGKTVFSSDNTVFYCMVKEKTGIFLIAFNPEQNSHILRMSIDAPMVVFAFELYFKHLWEQTAPVLKNKNAIIEWLQREIALLRNRVEPNYRDGYP